MLTPGSPSKVPVKHRNNCNQKYQLKSNNRLLSKKIVFKIKAIQLMASFELWYCFRKFYWFMLKTRENVRILF